MRANGMNMTRPLLGWYDSHARALPWRVPPGRAEVPDPYRVWLAEIMLQQTTVVTVAPYFERFLARWPTVEALAAADDVEVMRLWAGLGYYARARNLLAAARTAAAAGGFPRTEAGLRALPGVGPYTAAAIAAIAFGERATVIDGNIERVVTRLFAIAAPLPGAKAAIAEAIGPLVPAERPGDFAQAMMDLGSTICTPRQPNCLICPWAEECQGRISGLAPSLPRKTPKAPVPLRRGTAFWIERADGAVLLRRRPEKGLLGGMMEVPSTPWGDAPERPQEWAPLEARWNVLPGLVDHTFTHFHLELDVWRAHAIADGVLRDDGDYRWTAIHDLAGEALPTVMRKVVAHVLGVLAPKPLKRR